VSKDKGSNVIDVNITFGNNFFNKRNISFLSKSEDESS
jgi:hypothetical protein